MISTLRNRSIPTANILLGIVSFFFFTQGLSAQKKDGDTILFEYVPSEHSGVSFENKVIETVDRNISDYDYFYNGGGVAIGDLTNDGLPDIVFTGNDAANAVYINKGDFVFEELEFSFKLDDSKWSTGVTLIDINQDGYLDIYISYSGPDYRSVSTANELYINHGNEVFTEEASKYGIADNSLSTQSVFFDMDKDGDLDLWVLNHAVRNMADKVPAFMKAYNSLSLTSKKRFTSSLYSNNGNGTFTDVSSEAGIEELGFGLGVAVADFDGDGWQDVYVANDFFVPDRMYINQKNGTFRDDIKYKMPHSSFFSMGCDAADINNDGWTDIAVLDMTPADYYRSKMMMNAMSVNEFRYLKEGLNYLPQYMFNGLHINTSYGVMSDIALLAGVSKSDWSWAPLIADFNNDGQKDLFITNGFIRDTKNNDWRMELLDMIKTDNIDKEKYFQHLNKAEQTPLNNEVYTNQNGYEFENTTIGSGLYLKSFSNGAAYGDLDSDGDLDLVVNNLNQQAFLCKNLCVENEGGNYLRLKLHSKHILDGVRVSIEHDGVKQYLNYSFTKGYQSSVEQVLHFGTGNSTEIDELRIEWPNGLWSKIENVEVNKLHNIDVDELTQFDSSQGTEPTGFIEMTKELIVPPFYHKENYYDDFEIETLLPHKQSAFGPALAVGDINGDGLDDFFVGGGKGQRSAIYIQNESGVLIKYRTDTFKMTRHHEAQGALLFDCDGDDDLDLYVANGGGGDFKEEPNLLQDLLYINDGSGNYTLSNNLPEMLSSTLTVEAHDWDSDGDLDLFVGGRTSPGRYPISPDSYFLENQNGTFIDVTGTLSPEMKQLGMVTDALWFDWDGDEDKDLVIVGEWMPITVFVFDNGVYEKTNPIEHSSGWWNCIESGDFNNDGLEDLILGNLGLNNKFHPSKEKPLLVFANDFDNNGTLDIVLSKSYKDTLYPVRGKECSTMQMPFLKNSHPTFNDFASSNLFELYGQENLNVSYQRRVESFESIILQNIGKGDYSKVSLPIESQFSSINSMVIEDFDNDGFMDVLLAGNNSKTEAETTPYDAGKGLLLKGVGACLFEVDILTEKTGLFLPGDVQQLRSISLKGQSEKLILGARNNSKLIITMKSNYD